MAGTRVRDWGEFGEWGRVQLAGGKLCYHFGSTTNLWIYI